MRKIAFILISIAIIACFFIASRANYFSENLRRKSYQTFTTSRIIKNAPDDKEWNNFVNACKRMSGTKACGYRGANIRDFGVTGAYVLHPFIMECCKSKNCVDFKYGLGPWRNMCKPGELTMVTYSLY